MKSLATKIAFTITLAVAVVMAQAGDVALTVGHFTGLNDHTVTGTIQIVTLDGHARVVFGNDFFLDGAPDPKVSVGTATSHGTVLGDLKKLTGRQHYAVPANVKITDDTVIWIWCEQFAVPLGRST